MRPTLSLVCVCALLTAGIFLGPACSNRPISRIDSNRAVYESWPVDVQQAVYNGKAINGMTTEQVEMALGKPTEITSRSGKDGSTEEVWVYKKSSGKMPSILPNVSVGTNIGGVGVSTGGMGGGRGRGSSRNEDEDQDIIFKNGVVVRGSL